MTPADQIKKARAKASREHLEVRLLAHLRALGVPEPEREYRFNVERRWRADFAWPALRLLVEVEGGTYSGGRHTRGAGYAEDCEKYNAAAAVGWTVLRYTGALVRSGVAANQVASVVADRQSASQRQGRAVPPLC